MNETTFSNIFALNGDSGSEFSQARRIELRSIGMEDTLETSGIFFPGPFMYSRDDFDSLRAVRWHFCQWIANV